MLSKGVEKICRDIKALRIQGARNVAQSAIKGIALQARESDAETVEELKSDLLVAADELARARPTEPMLQNSLRFLFVEMGKYKKREVGELKAILAHEERVLLGRFAANAAKIADFGAQEIPKNATVLTHCHSSTVTGAIKRAYDLGKNPSAICLETRPRFQGRITAEELGRHGIETTLFVDSAVASVMKDATMVLVGADSVLSRGDLINKIGTSTVAQTAYGMDVPVLCCAELYKFDPLTLFGRVTEIEERDPKEVADAKKFKRVNVRNPAFDRTPAKYISAYITEKGVVSPHAIATIAMGEFSLE